MEHNQDIKIVYTGEAATLSDADRRIASPRWLRLPAHFFSFVFSPLLAPTYALLAAWATTVLRLLPGGTIANIILVVAGLTCVFPLAAIALMYVLKIVSDPGLNNRKERTLPFVVSLAGYAATLVFFIHIVAPWWLTMFMAGGIATLVISLIVTLRWKISIHLAAMGGTVAFILRLIQTGVTIFDAEGWLAAAILASGLVGTSRMILYRHTPWQVAAGFLNGFLCVYLAMLVRY